MKPPGPAKGKPTPPPQAALPHREPSPAATSNHELTVRYYRTMKPWRVYPLEVGFAPPSRGQPAAVPVLVRPVIPGAQVVPAERRLDPSRSGEKAQFQVTPLARGKLAPARVEIYHQGQLVQELKLRMKGTTQRQTWFLLFLSLAVPGLLLYATWYAPLKGTIRHPREKQTDLGQTHLIVQLLGAQAAAPAGAPAGGVTQSLAAIGVLDHEAFLIKKRTVPPPPPPGQGGPPPPVEGGENPNPGPGRPPMPATPPAVEIEMVERAGTPGAVLARRSRDFVHDNVPALPGRNYLADPAPTKSDLTKSDLAGGLGSLYDLTCQATVEKLGFWVATVLLGLTVLSWVGRRSYQVTARKSLTLPLAPTPEQAAETLPLTQGEGPVVEPA